MENNIFIEFCLKYLKIQHVKYEIQIDDIADNLKGFVYKDKSKYIICVKDKMKHEQQLLTVAHELVHIKQYVYDNLEYHLSNFFHIPYDDRWWEIEARNITRMMVERFSDDRKKI